MSSSHHGLLDTNVIIHSLADDPNSEECWWFMEQVRAGKVAVTIDPLVVHELTYSLPKYAKQLSRADIAGYIETLLYLPGMRGDIERLAQAIELWKSHPGIGFVDCYLAARSNEDHVPVYTKNVRHLRRLGAEAPDPLPGS